MANTEVNLLINAIGKEGYQFSLPLGAVHAFKGTLISQLTSGGYAVPYSTASSGYCVGVALHEQDNSAGDAGDKRLQVASERCFAFTNGADSDAFDEEDLLGSAVYGTDDHTVAKTSSSGTRQAVGVFMGMEADGKVRVYVSPALGRQAAIGDLADAGMTVAKRTVTIGHADLTDGDDGDPQAFNIGAVLPANARIMGVDMRAYTPFTGGGASALTCDVGTSGDVDALVDGADLFAAAVDGGPASMPAGIRPNKTFASAGAQLIATLTPDGSTAGTDYTAGAVTIDVLYAVLA